MKLSKQYAEYGMAKKGGDRCDDCRWFNPETCEIVEGRIAAGGWCRFHHRKGGMKPRDDRAYVAEMRRRTA